MNIAVIPARGGSKRIPKKNIKVFSGKPMIAWSIEAALASELFDDVIVSTDNIEIAEVARSYGAKVPFTRPDELSDDFAVTADVMLHALEWIISQNYDPKAVCCIYATAPFIDVNDLHKSWEIFKTNKWDYVFTATDFPAPIFRSFQETDKGGIEMFYPEFFNTRSQDLPVALHDAGQFYWGKPSAWEKKKRVFDKQSMPHIIPRYRVQDIDSEEDWIRAEAMAKSFLNK